MGFPSAFGSRIAGLAAAAAILLLAAGWAFLNSKGHRDSVDARASEAFGAALERAGIPTQAGPSR